MNLTLSLTHDCNLGCTYCYAGAKRRQVMSREVIDHSIDLALRHSNGTMQLGFFGGEPLLAWDLLHYATETVEDRCHAEGIALQKTVTTNGTCLNEERAAWLGAHDFYAAISIDGNRAMHDMTRPLRTGASSFDAVLGGLGLLQKHLSWLEVIAVPDPSNVQHLAEGVCWLVEEQGVDRIAVNPNFYTEWDEKALAAWQSGFEAIGDRYIAWFRQGRPVFVNFINGKIITRLKKGFECKDRCGFGEAEIAVAPSGRIYPCERIVAEDNNEELCIGHVQTGFEEDKRQAILQRRGNINGECIECSFRSRCMNWCCCINYALTGAIDSTDGVVCFHERSAIEVADRVGGVLYNESNPDFLRIFYYDDTPKSE